MIDSRWQRPFPDVSIDRRDEEQQSDDIPAAEQQSKIFDPPNGGVVVDGRIPEDTLAEILLQRRAGVAGAVQFEVVPTDAGGLTFVIPNEVLLRVGPDHDPGALLQTRLDREFLRVPLLDDDDCPELEGLVNRYVPKPEMVRRDIDVPATIRELTEAGLAAGRTCVGAFQQRSSSYRVVVKQATGASPTTVTNKELFVSPDQKEPEATIIVAVIDTGITTQTRDDGWLTDIARTPAGVSSPGSIDKLDVFPAPDLLDFAAGHGTFAAGIIKQIEPQAEVRLYAALDSDGLGNEIDLACAMIRAVKDGAQIVNMSLGLRTVDDQPPTAFEAALDIIDAYVEENGGEPPVFVAAAGNFGDSVPVWPAASRRVVSVAGLTADMRPAAWSSRGVWVDCSTIGTGVVSTFVEGDEDPAFGDPSSFPRDAWALWTGTSFAAPQIAGAIARTCRENALPPRVAQRHLIDAGSPLPDFGRAIPLLPGTMTS